MTWKFQIHIGFGCMYVCLYGGRVNRVRFHFSSKNFINQHLIFFLFKLVRGLVSPAQHLMDVNNYTNFKSYGGLEKGQIDKIFKSKQVIYLPGFCVFFGRSTA